MTRAHKSLIVMLVALVGIWGCSQGDSKGVSSRHLDRIKSLEAKCASLEQECQAALADRDQLKQRLGDVDKERAHLVTEVETGKAVVRERDDLKSLVTTRTSERDTYQGQLEELRKGIRTLLGRLDSALPPSDNSEQKTSSTPRL